MVDSRSGPLALPFALFLTGEISFDGATHDVRLVSITEWRLVDNGVIDFLNVDSVGLIGHHFCGKMVDVDIFVRKNNGEVP